MTRFVLAQLRARRSRVVTLASGLLAAVVGFVLLLSTVTTSELRVRQTVDSNFRGAYDILVRPGDSLTPLESTRGLVRNNYLSGSFGGITVAQWQRILAMPGVEVAAPIANLGYVTPNAQILAPLPADLRPDKPTVYRLRASWTADRDLSRYPGSVKYLYLTPNEMTASSDGSDILELIPGRPPQRRGCAGFDPLPQGPGGPFARDNASTLFCLSSGYPNSAAVLGLNGLSSREGFVGTSSDVFFPLLLAAIDPVQEDKLLGLSGTVTMGRALTASDAPRLAPPYRNGQRGPDEIPIVASSRLFLDTQVRTSVEELSVPAGTDLASRLATDGARAFLTPLRGEPVASIKQGPEQGYADYLDEIANKPYDLSTFKGFFFSYKTVDQVQYDVTGPDRLRPRPVTGADPSLVWTNPFEVTGPLAPPGNEDVQFRTLTQRPALNVPTKEQAGEGAPISVRLVGRFDPSRLPGFSALSEVPLETYYPPTVQGGDPASRAALGDRPLQPSMNVGGYVSQPPLLLTTISSAARLTDTRAYPVGSAFVEPTGRPPVSQDAPISVIRVRVADAGGTDRTSQERIRKVAERIVLGTGLAVDVTIGSSPRPQQIQLAAGSNGRPALTLVEGWVQKGAALRILDRVDRKSLLLFVLVLVVCLLFLANGAAAAVRSRRTEIGVLLCLGWGRRQMFRVVLAELLLIGVVTGVAGTVLAAVLASVFDLNLPAVAVLLVTPVAAVVAVLAGTGPAWRASRGDPLDAVRPAVVPARRARQVRSLRAMALTTLRRLPGRTAAAAGALAVGVAALTALLAIDSAFAAGISGTRLGDALGVQVRGVDYAGAALAITLGVASVADIIALNIRDRAAELVTLRTVGWRDRTLSRVAIYEGLAVGLLGTLTGALAGITIALVVGTDLRQIALALVLSVTVCTAITAAAAAFASRTVSRLQTTTTLAAE